MLPGSWGEFAAGLCREAGAVRGVQSGAGAGPGVSTVQLDRDAHKRHAGGAARKGERYREAIENGFGAQAVM